MNLVASEMPRVSNSWGSLRRQSFGLYSEYMHVSPKTRENRHAQEVCTDLPGPMLTRWQSNENSHVPTPRRVTVPRIPCNPLRVSVPTPLFSLVVDFHHAFIKFVVAVLIWPVVIAGTGVTQPEQESFTPRWSVVDDALAVVVVADVELPTQAIGDWRHREMLCEPMEVRMRI